MGLNILFSLSVCVTASLIRALRDAPGSSSIFSDQSQNQPFPQGSFYGRMVLKSMIWVLGFVLFCFVFQSTEDVLKLTGVMVAQLCEYAENHSITYFKWVNLNKALIKRQK